MTTGERIKSARNEAGITQKELADKLGVSFTLVSQYERDMRKPKIETLQKIAEALKVPVRSLFEMPSPQNNEEDIKPGDTFLDGHIIVKDVKYRENGLVDVTFGAGLKSKSLEDTLVDLLNFHRAAELAGVSPESMLDMAEQILLVSLAIQKERLKPQESLNTSADGKDTIQDS